MKAKTTSGYVNVCNRPHACPRAHKPNKTHTHWSLVVSRTTGSTCCLCPSGGRTLARAEQLSTVCSRTESWSSSANPAHMRRDGGLANDEIGGTRMKRDTTGMGRIQHVHGRRLWRGEGGRGCVNDSRTSFSTGWKELRRRKGAMAHEKIPNRSLR